MIGTRAIASALVLLPWLAGCGGGASADSADAGSEGAAPSALVETLPLQQGSLPRTVTAFGVVQVDPSAQNSIAAPVAAQVTQVFVRGGQTVAAGAPLVQLRPTPRTQASYSQAVSTLKVATETTRRTRELLTQFLATRQQLWDAEKAESDARAALAALQAQGAAGPTTLRAPFAAIVTSVATTVRALVTEGTPLLELARPSGLVLMVGVTPDAAAAIEVGEPVSVVSVGSGTTWQGAVLERGAVVQGDSGLVAVAITLPPQTVMPGQSAQATISVGSVSGYLVPHDAVLLNENGGSYVVQAVGGKGKLVPVTVLGTQDSRDVITGPLDASAPLVTTGNYQVQNDMPLRMTTAAQPSAPARQ